MTAGWLRNHIATAGLKQSIEGSYGMPVELVDPDGNDVLLNDDGDTLRGQVLYDYDAFDPESGDPIIVKEIRVTLRKTALARVPVSGETWGVSIPLDPADQATLTTFLTNGDEAIMGGDSVGFVTMLLKQADQI